MTVAAGAELSAASPARSNYFLMETYYLRASTQLPRLNEFMSQGLLPAVSTVHDGPRIFLEAFVAAHMPQFVTITGYQSLEEIETVRAALAKNRAYQQAFAAWENGPEPPYEHYSQTLLKATPYCPVLAPLEKIEKPRVFELRVYHSPTWKQLAALHERFAGPEIKIFHRVGIHPILYSETSIGPNMPNLTYLTPFDSLAAREKAWDSFASDQEWIKVRKDSVDRSGQISSVIQITLLRATPYSQIR